MLTCRRIGHRFTVPDVCANECCAAYVTILNFRIPGVECRLPALQPGSVGLLLLYTTLPLAALVVLGAEALRESGAEPQARLVDYDIAGVAPEVMGIGPVPAIRRLLERQKLTLADIDLIELNEAFAAQVIACDRELGFDSERLNVNGGAIALGHPIGCTGVRITATLLHEMRRRGSRYGLSTLCISGGMGIALLVERV